MTLFSKEAKEIRDSIVRDLPAYNDVLSIHAESFEEVALRMLAEDRGIPFNPMEPPVPPCPFCGEEKRVHKKEKSTYICRSCGKTYSANHNSISSGTKCDSLTWMKVLHCVLNSATLKQTCDYCGVSPETYYNLRGRLFYAMSLVLSNVRLYGEIQIDTTFVRSNYKGIDLQIHDYPEDSPFAEDGIKPRAAKARGGSFSYEEKNANNLAILAAIDDRGHVITRFAGVGIANHKKYLQYVPAAHYLATVPETDPFVLSRHSAKQESKTAVGSPTFMVADKEGALRKYAEHLGIPFEAHVYRRNGIQYKLSKDAHNIQRVNALHHRLKNFLRNSNYVSSKYLPGYLTLFEFLENTGGTQDAIERLFKVLAKPGIGKPPSFFKELFTVPDYLLDWLQDDNPLRKFPESKILSFYLYDQMKRPELYPESTITMRQIEEETGYTPPTIRKTYRDFDRAGYRDIILSRYLQTGINDKTRQRKKTAVSSRVVNPIVLSIYDEYAAIKRRPVEKRISLQELLDIKNKEFGTDYTRTNILAKFKTIEELGIREPMPPLYRRKYAAPEHSIPPHAFQILDDYNAIILSYRQKGEPIPRSDKIHSALADKYGLSQKSISGLLVSARAARRKGKR